MANPTSPAAGNDASTIVYLRFEGDHGSQVIENEAVGGVFKSVLAIGAAKIVRTDPEA